MIAIAVDSMAMSQNEPRVVNLTLQSWGGSGWNSPCMCSGNHLISSYIRLLRHHVLSEQVRHPEIKGFQWIGTRSQGSWQRDQPGLTRVKWAPRTMSSGSSYYWASLRWRGRPLTCLANKLCGCGLFTCILDKTDFIKIMTELVALQGQVVYVGEWLTSWRASIVLTFLSRSTCFGEAVVGQAVARKEIAESIEYNCYLESASKKAK